MREAGWPTESIEAVYGAREPNGPRHRFACR
jgi:hypothetical protein